MLARILLASAAIAACAWMVLGGVQAHDIEKATNIIYSPTGLSDRQAKQASSLLDTAATLNPDSQVRLLRSRLAYEQGHFDQAITLAQQVTRDEPANFLAWYRLSQVSDSRKEILREALDRIPQLLAHVIPGS